MKWPEYFSDKLKYHINTFQWCQYRLFKVMLNYCGNIYFNMRLTYFNLFFIFLVHSNVQDIKMFLKIVTPCRMQRNGTQTAEWLVHGVICKWLNIHTKCILSVWITSQRWHRLPHRVGHHKWSEWSQMVRTLQWMSVPLQKQSSACNL